MAGYRLYQSYRRFLVALGFLRPAKNVIVPRPDPEITAPRVSLIEESKPDTFRTDSTTLEGTDKRIDEKKEMTALRMEMERRLKDQVAAREQKIAQLARNCQKLEPGEAASILLELDDNSVSDVFGHMDKGAALKIAAILDKLGRKGANSIE